MTQITGNKKVIFSGIQPSGTFTIGNYIGALRNWVKLQDEYLCYYCVVDLHALTVRQVPADLRRRTYESLALLIACGLDPEKNVMFVQSHVPAHSELAWLLNCYTYMGELGRMIQYKEKSAKHADNVNAGLFDYPVLMAADILLYQADMVPVGSDQRQHLEMARDIAIRFNNAYSPTFQVPEPYIGQHGARIMSLQEPTAKMSKSDDEGSFISLLDPADVIRAKIRRAVTDSEGMVAYDPEKKPGVSNLMTIYAALTDCTMEQAQRQLDGGGYGQMKETVADAVIEKLTTIQQEFKRLMQDKEYLNGVMRQNSEIAARNARRTLSKVQKKLGLVARD